MRNLLVIIITWFLFIIMMITCSDITNAHENPVWKDIKTTGPMISMIPCGAGYYIIIRPDGSKEPMLLAGKCHLMKNNHGIETCNELFKYLLEGE